MYNDNTNPITIPGEGLNAYIAKVFGWMFLGLVITAVTSIYTVLSVDWATLASSFRLVFYGIIIAELALVFIITRAIDKLSTTLATFLFLLYSALSGATLSVIFLRYDAAMIVQAFTLTAATFGIMSVYGMVTKKDLTSVGNLLFMGLIGIIIMSIFNWFMQSETMFWIISFVCLFVFLGLTAYDTQKIKGYYYAYEGNEQMQKKAAIISALSLYLDFINLFLTILRLLGRRR